MSTTQWTGKNYRITFLTERLVRLEYQSEGRFEDRPTTAVQCRDFPPVEVEARRFPGRVELDTPFLHLSYDEKPFSPEGPVPFRQGRAQRLYERLAPRSAPVHPGGHGPDAGSGGRGNSRGGWADLPKRVFRAGRQPLHDPAGGMARFAPGTTQSRICTFLAMVMITPPACGIFTACPAPPRCCPAGRWATGGAAFSATPSIAIWR